MPWKQKNRGAVRHRVEKFDEGIKKFKSDKQLRKKNVPIEMESRRFALKNDL